MLPEHAKVLHLLATSGEISGRKKLQKIVYISKKLKLDFRDAFTFHMYGPYSEELSMRVQELANLGMIEEEKVDRGNYVTYTYRPTRKGAQFLTTYPVQMDGLEPIVATLKDKSSRFLELVATMLYFEDLEGTALWNRIRKVKGTQRYTDDERRQAELLLDEIGASMTRRHCNEGTE